MSRSWDLAAAVCASAWLACAPSGAPAAPTNAPHAVDLVDETCALQLRSAFWVNLHHVLYAEASARRGPGVRSGAGTGPAHPVAELPPDEQPAWQRAVAYYGALATQDLLFDDAMSATRLALIARDDAQPPAGLAAEHAAVLAAAAPIYRARWWPRDDRAIRAWIADVVPRVAGLCAPVSTRLAALYQTPWFTAPVRVDVVIVGSWSGAYTATTPTHITFSASDPRQQQWAAVEMMFHEASHALIDPVEHALDREAQATHKAGRDLWHAALFYTAGEVVRQALAARDVAYTPYLYATGLFDRAWPALRAPIEAAWRAYVDGAATLDQAVRALVAACPDAAP